jgi:hypothetical protein
MKEKGYGNNTKRKLKDSYFYLSALVCTLFFKDDTSETFCFYLAAMWPTQFANVFDLITETGEKIPLKASN